MLCKHVWLDFIRVVLPRHLIKCVSNAYAYRRACATKTCSKTRVQTRADWCRKGVQKGTVTLEITQGPQHTARRLVHCKLAYAMVAIAASIPSSRSPFCIGARTTQIPVGYARQRNQPSGGCATAGEHYNIRLRLSDRKRTHAIVRWFRRARL